MNSFNIVIVIIGLFSSIKYSDVVSTFIKGQESDVLNSSHETSTDDEYDRIHHTEIQIIRSAKPTDNYKNSGKKNVNDVEYTQIIRSAELIQRVE